MFFTQAEFDAYNTLGSIDLPINGNDAIGKSNLLIDKYEGISNITTGLPNTYIGALTTINPNDADIVWNAASSRWEVSFDVAGFSGFFVRTNNTPLAINNVVFTGKKNSTSDELNWLTIAEKDIQYFELMHSTDGVVFTKITTTPTKSSSATSNESNYTYNNPNPKIGHNYYKLLSVANNGVVKTEAAVIDLYRLANNAALGIFPNPATTTITLSLNVAKASKMMIKLVNATGTIVHQQTVNTVVGSNNFELDMMHLANGIYTLQCNNGLDINYAKQIVKQ